MKKITILFCLVLLVFTSKLKADEGMWLPMFIERLNYVDMQKEGLHLTAEEIYSINHSSLKDAVIQFANGCTGEIISDEGLILTNHHCGYGSIQSHSTVQNDYLTNGFWAMNKSEEMPNEGLTVRFLVKMENVTEQLKGQLGGIKTEKERDERIAEVTKWHEKSDGNNGEYEVVIKSFFNGNEFYMFVYQVFKDVRLVGAPPVSIGKFGAETDNWMWPRHTGDFSLFRVYMSPDGKPAKFSKDNIPYKPKYSLPISLKGVKKGDFAMIMGYPGTTDRFLPSYGVMMNLELKNPSIVNIRTEKLAIMKQFMNADPAVKLQYESKYASSANYWKYYIGESKALQRLKVYNQKKELEDNFNKWVATNRNNRYKYINVIKEIQDAYAIIKKYELQRWYFIEGIQRGAEILNYAMSFSNLSKELKADSINKNKIKILVDALKSSSDKYFKDYYKPADRKILESMLSLYYKNVPREQQPEMFLTIADKCKGDFSAYTEKLFSKTIFADKSKVDALLNNPNAKTIENDIVYQFANAFYINSTKLNNEVKYYSDELEQANRLFVAGIREMMPEKKFAPNANSTMRLTYGQVLDYYPADAVHYDYKTTLEGVIEKEDSTNEEFVIPPKLKQLYKSKDYGIYGENGTMPVAFLSNTDITGGNSGSPVINGDGQLIGIAFDGNWEAMSGNITFNPNLQRTISVDIRYVLFIIDKYAGATNIIKELNLKSN